jgi:hypothetical protein
MICYVDLFLPLTCLRQRCFSRTRTQLLLTSDNNDMPLQCKYNKLHEFAKSKVTEKTNYFIFEIREKSVSEINLRFSYRFILLLNVSLPTVLLNI